MIIKKLLLVLIVFLSVRLEAYSDWIYRLEPTIHIANLTTRSNGLSLEKDTKLDYGLSFQADDFDGGYILSWQRTAPYGLYDVGLHQMEAVYYRKHPYAPNLSWFVGARSYHVSLGPVLVNERLDWFEGIAGGQAQWQLSSAVKGFAISSIGKGPSPSKYSLKGEAGLLVDISDDLVLKSSVFILKFGTKDEEFQKLQQYGLSIALSITI